MEINIKLNSDSDNSYTDEEQLKIISPNGCRVYLELQNPYRLVSVDLDDLVRTVNFLAGA